MKKTLFVWLTVCAVVIAGMGVARTFRAGQVTQSNTLEKGGALEKNSALDKNSSLDKGSSLDKSGPL